MIINWIIRTVILGTIYTKCGSDGCLEPFRCNIDLNMASINAMNGSVINLVSRMVAQTLVLHRNPLVTSSTVALSF